MKVKPEVLKKFVDDFRKLTAAAAELNAARDELRQIMSEIAGTSLADWKFSTVETYASLHLDYYRRGKIRLWIVPSYSCGDDPYGYGPYVWWMRLPDGNNWPLPAVRNTPAEDAIRMAGDILKRFYR